MALNLYWSGQCLGLIFIGFCVLTVNLNILFYFYSYGKLKVSTIPGWHTAVVRYLLSTTGDRLMFYGLRQ